MATEIVISALIYGVVIWAVWTKAVQREQLDMTCPEGPDTKDRSVCRDGNGKLWARYRHQPGESPRASLAKMRVLNRNWGKPIIWRRCFALAFSASILLCLVTQQRLPTGFELIGSMVVLFLVWYVSHSFFQVHHDQFIEEAIEQHLRAVFATLPREAHRA
jgi:hypothetical protein